MSEAMNSAQYPIGTPGQPWGDSERAHWQSLQRTQRSYARDVVTVIDRLRERFRQEAVAAGRLSHPGIVRYVAHGVAVSGERYLAMEWLDGEDLRQRSGDDPRRRKRHAGLLRGQIG